MPDVTQLLEAAANGDAQAAADLLPQVYDELRKLAAARMAAEKPGQTLQATALVHEAFVRLVASGKNAGPGADAAGSPMFANRAHFFAAAAEAMRRILIETARRKGCQKRGDGRQRIELEDVSAGDSLSSLEDVLVLDEALAALARYDSEKAELVKLRYFAGLTLETTAETLGISVATAKRRWAIARAWLYDWISNAQR